MKKHRIGNEYSAASPAVRTYKIKAYDFTSKNDGTATVGYADNPMDDPSLVNESAEESQLDHLHDLLNKAGINDDEILSGLTMTPRGYAKVAAAMGIGKNDVQPLIDSLITSLKGENANDVLLNELRKGLEDQSFSFMDEINNDVGTMEFPFTLGDKTGFGTAAYKGDDANFYIKVISAYDESGNIIHLTDDEKKQLKQQAINFIGDA